MGFLASKESSYFFEKKVPKNFFAPLRAVLKRLEQKVFCGAFFQKSDRLLFKNCLLR